MRTVSTKLFIALSFIIFAGAQAENSTSSSTTKDAVLGEWGIETHYIDNTVNPGDDFYRYVNGGWLDSAKLPVGMPMFGSFIHVYLETEQQIESIVADILARDWPDGSTEGEIKALYLSYMDTEAINARGIKPLQPELDELFAAKSHADVAEFMVKGFNPLFPRFTIAIDDANPDRYIVRTGQSGTELPLEYYLREGEPFASIMAAYEAYYTKLLTLAGIDNPDKRAADVIALEKQLAKVSWSASQQRDKVANYHPMSFDELKAYAPGAEWDARQAASGFGAVKEIVVRQDSAVQQQAKVFAETPIETLQSWAAAHLISGQAKYLADDFSQAHFEFFDTTLNGVKTQRPREARALGQVGKIYGEPLGKLYVERYFPESSKLEVEKMVGYMQVALHKRLEQLDWMDEATRKEAIAKLDHFSVAIAYPDRWKDYSRLDFAPDDLFANYRAWVNWNANVMIGKLHRPLDRWEWFTEPQVINAFYAPAFNSITFPAGILQPPFFDPNADPAVNFGAVGAVISHEIGHGFDDQGSQSDGKGVLRNWWTDEARAEFKRRAAKLGAQYEQYAMVDGANLNGELTMGENLGDLAGITIAYAAFKEYEREHYDGGKAPVIDGYTADQRFFLGFAQLWRDLATDQIWQQLALTDGHSPGRFRTNGIVRNFDPWYEAFNVTEDNALYLPPEDRVRMW